MRALVTRLREDGIREKVLVNDWPEPPEPVGNQVKTRTRYTGVTNGTERNDLLGGNYATPDDRLPAGWGYQNVGEVIATGPDCKMLQVGDVIYSSAGHDEFTTIPEDWLLVKLPAGIDLKEAALFGMASVAMRTCRHADIKIGENVLIVGAGFLGQICAQITSLMGGYATICDVDVERLQVAEKIGAIQNAVNVSGEGWEKNITEASFDVVIDVAGVPGMEDKLISAVKMRGRVMLIAGRDRVNSTFNNGQGHEVTIKQNSHFDVTDLHQLCRYVEQGFIKIAPLVKDVIAVADANQIYDTLRDEPAKLGGTVFIW